MEIDILNFIQTLRNPFLDWLMPVISHMGNGVLYIVLAVVLLCFKKTRKIGVVLTLALLLEYTIVSIILKPAVERPRPYTVNTLIQLLIEEPEDWSFPSGHTSAAFTMIFALYFMKNRWWIPMAIAGVLIAFSRMYLYVHYPTDIFFGACIGILSAFIVVKGMEWYGNHKQSQI